MNGDHTQPIFTSFFPRTFESEEPVAELFGLMAGVRKANSSYREWNRLDEKLIYRSLTGFFPYRVVDVSMSRSSKPQSPIVSADPAEITIGDVHILTALCNMRLQGPSAVPYTQTAQCGVSVVFLPAPPTSVEHLLKWKLLTLMMQPMNRRGPLRFLMETANLYDVSVGYAQLFHAVVINMVNSSSEYLLFSFFEIFDKWEPEDSDLKGAKERLALELNCAFGFRLLNSLLPYVTIDSHIGKEEILEKVEKITLASIKNELASAFRVVIPRG